jgi:hypothetical protein
VYELGLVAGVGGVWKRFSRVVGDRAGSFLSPSFGRERVVSEDTARSPAIVLDRTVGP